MGSTFAKALGILMDEHRLKPTAVATIAKVERQTVYNWLNGAAPGAEPLELLSKYFGATEAELMYGRVEFSTKRPREIIEVVEKAALKNEAKLMPGKKAKLITVLYEKHAAGTPPTKKEVSDLVILSA